MDVIELEYPIESADFVVKSADLNPKSLQPLHEKSLFSEGFIFHQDSYLSILEEFRNIKSASPSGSWSLGVWSKKLGLSSTSSLTNIMKGRAIPSDEVVEGLAQTMGLKPLEIEYFQTLVELKRQEEAQGPFHLAMKRKLNALRSLAQTDWIKSERFEYIARPHHHTIREMVNLKDFKEDYDWIASRLKQPAGQPKIDAQTVKASIENLIHVGLLERSKDGHLRMTTAFHDTFKDVPSNAVRLHQEQILEQAKEAIHHVDLSRRHVTTNVLTIRSEHLPEIKAFIQGFREEFNGNFDCMDRSGDEVYELAIQFFPLTQSSKDSK